MITRWTLFLLLLSATACSRAAAAVVVDEGFEWRNITPESAYYLDPTNTLSIEEIAALPANAFTPAAADSLAFGVSPGRVWLRLEIASKLDRGRGLILELNNARLEEVRLYYPEDGAWAGEAVGTDHPVEDRLARHLLPALRLPVAPGETMVCFLSVKHSGSTRFQLHLSSYQRFRSLVTDRTAATFVLTGGFLAMVFFNLVVFLQLRERAYLYLCAAIFSYLAFTMALNGAGYVWVWPNAHWWSGRAVTTTSMLHQVFITLFFHHFMRPMWGRIPWFPTFSRALFLIFLALFLLALTDLPLKYYIVSFMGGMGPLLILFAALHAWRQGYRPAAHFALAWFVSVVGVVYFSLIQLGYIEHSFQREMYFPIGYLLSVVIWNISLAERLRVSERATREQLEAQVRERTSELQQALDEVKTLSGLLPICSECKKIRDDQGYWQGVEQYIRSHTDARFTHGMCPECFSHMYPAYADRVATESAQETP